MGQDLNDNFLQDLNDNFLQGAAGREAASCAGTVSILGYAGYLRDVFALTCDHRGRIQPTSKMETMTNLKGIKRVNH